MRIQITLVILWPLFEASPIPAWDAEKNNKIKAKKMRWGSKGYPKIHFTAEIIFSVLNKAKKKQKKI